MTHECVIETNPEFAERWHIRGRKGDPAVIRTKRGKLHVAIERRDHRMKTDDLPSEWNDERVATVPSWSKDNSHRAGRPTTCPRRSNPHAKRDPHAKRLAVFFGCARERREPTAVSKKSLLNLFEWAC